MRTRRDGNDADQRLPVVLRLQGLRCGPETPSRRLLCLLQLRHRQMPADTGRAILLRLDFGRQPASRRSIECPKLGRLQPDSRGWEAVILLCAEHSRLRTAGDGLVCTHER